MVGAQARMTFMVTVLCWEFLVTNISDPSLESLPVIAQYKTSGQVRRLTLCFVFKKSMTFF